MLLKLKRLLQKTAFYRLYLLCCKRYRFWVLDKQFPRIYRRAANKAPDNNKVLFLECSRRELSGSFQVVYETLRRNTTFDLRCHYLLHTTASRREQRKRSRAFLRDLATAKYVFFDEATDLLSKVELRKETKIVQLWHGCGAFKRFGRSVAEKQFGASADYMDSHPFHRHYALVTVSSPAVVWAYEEAMDYSHESGVVQPTGVSRTDVFFDETFLQRAGTAVVETVPQAKGKRVLLYAPTFRGEIADAKAPDVLDMEQLRQALGEEWVLLCKHHPHVKHRPAIPQSCRNFAFDVTDTLSIETLLPAADVCISDYSSLVFEYSMFEKPMLFLAYDLEDYFDWRGFFYDYETLAPGPVVRDTAGVIDFMQSLPQGFDRERVRTFRQTFMSSCDGHATERILNCVFGDDLDRHRKELSDEKTN